MGKKKLRAKYISKGQRKPTNPKVLNAIKRERTYVEISLNKLRAYYEGRKVYLTIDNPNPNETAKRKIRVPAEHVLGDPRNKAHWIIRQQSNEKVN